MSTSAKCDNCFEKKLNLISYASGPNNPFKRLLHIILIKRECFINDLWEFVAFQTVSAREDKRNELYQACEWLIKRMAKLDIVVFAEKMGHQMMEDSLHTIKMPNTIIGVLTQSPGNRTILVYGYMDVEDADVEEGWRWDPFVLTENGDYLYGRGSVHSKGPLMCWLNAIQSYKDANLRLPVNLVFIIESMGKSGSLGLEDVVRNRISFFREVSCVCILEKRWMSANTPCIIYGSRGLIYYHLEVQCSNRDVCSCEHGGTMYEALPDLFYLLSSLVNPNNTIPIERVEDMYDLDKSVVKCSHFNPKQFRKNIKANKMPNGDKKAPALAANWGFPHISIHGIEGAVSNDELTFIIPHKVIGKFSIALAPHQNAAAVTQTLTQHLGEVWAERGSPNRMALCEKFTIPSWSGDCETQEYRAAVRAMRQVYNTMPDITREGGAILAPSIFKNVLGKNVICLPIAEFDDGGRTINERLKIDNYLKGSQMVAAFLNEYAQNKETPLPYRLCLSKLGTQKK